LDFQHLLPEESNAELSGDLVVHHGHPDSVAGPGQPAHSTITSITISANNQPADPYPAYAGYIQILEIKPMDINFTHY
jgi:hypothetical protein